MILRIGIDRGGPRLGIRLIVNVFWERGRRAYLGRLRGWSLLGRSRGAFCSSAV